ncbi:dockerin type I domain-containing protein [Paenibacillus sp. LHD-38]|uniref:dockerin type I domain-containing protein n=1 Tax=Paenibacillus sp. LHD-38 TaxID=3072143 RepID=UPI00280DE03A|nr:cohesin domain-containing protein [Paenibacillus sp. LHD-38]MDQ8737142.1 cohesin domain-containing protein [Paenibacillus sp. LHD-38]
MMRLLTRKNVCFGIAGLLLLLGTLWFNDSVLFAEDNAATGNGNAYYVDCSLTTNGSGTSASPFSTLGAIHQLVLQPGDSVLFKRGSVCLGQFGPSGSGTEADPIVIGAYGTGTDKPVINANGQTNAVLLKNMAYVQIQDLELTAPGDNKTPRRGLHVLGENGGDLNGVVVQNLTVHDVRGVMPSSFNEGASSSTGKFGYASGGIIIEAQGTVTPTAFHDIQILDNEVYSVDRQGIYFWSNWCKRPDLKRWGSDCSANWYPHTNALIKGNQLTDIGGDGIVMKMVSVGLVERNTLDGFNVRSRSYNAGMWVANSDDVTFQYNRASGGVSTLDGMAFDIDHATNRTVFQYNVSSNNEGGFFLFCPDPTSPPNVKNFTIRYNISINDKAEHFMIGCGGTISNGEIYNNTIYAGDNISARAFGQNTGTISNVKYFNNIVYKTGAGTISWDVKTGEKTVNFTLDNNVFYNIAPAPSMAAGTILTDPGFMNPAQLNPHGLQLGVGSSALGAGKLASNNGGLDYFANAVSATALPNIGAYEGDGVLPLPETGCMPAFSAALNHINLSSGSATITATVQNPCAGAQTNISVSAAGPAGVQMTPSLQTIPGLGAQQSATVEFNLTGDSQQPIASYPITVTASTSQGEPIGSAALTVDLITALWDAAAAENFEAMTVGSAPAGWETSGNVTPVVASQGGAKALKLSQSGTLNRGIWTFPEQAGTVKLSAKVMAGQTNTPLGLHVLDASNGEVLKLSLNMSGNVSYTRGASFVDTTTPYAANSWILLEVFVDRETSSYIVFLDGVKVGVGTLGPSTNAISKLRLQVPSGSAGGVFYVDEISVSTPGEPAEVLQTTVDGPDAMMSGEFIALSYGIMNAEIPVMGQDFVVRYDTDVLRFVDAESLVPGISIISEKAQEDGSLRILLASLGLENAISGDLPQLLNLTFEAKTVAEQASAAVSVESATLAGGDGAEFAAAASAHTVAVAPATGSSGDLNGDGKISVGDLAMVSAHYGKTSSNPSWQTIKAADIDGDGTIGLEDLAILARRLLEAAA